MKELGTSNTSERKLVHDVLDRLRNLLSNKQLALFIGEEISSLSSKYDTWWDFVCGSEKDASEMINGQEKFFLESLDPPGQSNIHNTLRTVGTWNVIFTTNMDRLIERLIWKGEEIEKLRLNQISGLDFGEWIKKTDSIKLLVKIFGDSGVVTKYNENYKDILQNIPAEIMTRLKNIFDKQSFVFVGVDTAKYQNFFTNIVCESKAEHFMIEKNKNTTVIKNRSLCILQADLDLWEFSRYLSSGTFDGNFISGTVYERSYLASQREEYLLHQLKLETEATEIHFQTLQISNALATDEILLYNCKPKLADIYVKDPLGVYTSENVERAYHAMMGRRDNIWKLIDEGRVPVKALFYYEEFIREIDCKEGVLETEAQIEQRKMAIRKYADSILRAKSVLRPNSTLELLVVEGLSATEMKAMQQETFAILKLKGGIDEAVCYAEMAKPGEKQMQTHLIVVNGIEVHNKRKVYERNVSRSWDNKQSLLKLTAKLIDVNRSVNALPNDMRERLESLNSVVAMLDRSIDAKSLIHIGGGSFGDVYKAIWNGMPVALKFLKEAAHPDDIYRFQVEYDSLRQAEHENIVKVFKMTVESNRLGLIMEYVDGYNLRELLIERSSQSTDVIYRCAVQLSSAISHLHSLKIIHRDIKTDNILVDKDLNVFKLADFGLARVVERTEQYKTVKGTFRYMAPEILKLSKEGAAKYSLTVDVYSYGLVLLEMVTGSPVFQDLTKEELEYGKKMGSLEATVPEWCSENHGELLSEIIRRAVSDMEHRPSMETIHEMLVKETLDVIEEPNELNDRKLQQSSLEIVCLGTGKGATTLLTGEPSSSFVILNNGKPLLIVDLGFGICHSYKKYIGQDAPFQNIFITHNHADHSAELPVVLAIIHDARQKLSDVPFPKVYAAPEVAHRLRSYRLPEVYTQAEVDDLCYFQLCEQNKKTPLGDDGLFHLTVLQSQHSEVCYGFILYKHNEPILSYTGDSGFNQTLYDQIFTAPNVIVDARSSTSYEHASFNEVENYIKNKQASFQRVFITGYGVEKEYASEGIDGATQLKKGGRYTLVDTKTNSASQSSSANKWLTAPRTNITAEYMMPIETA